jgi:hypothetical protein
MLILADRMSGQDATYDGSRYFIFHIMATVFCFCYKLEFLDFMKLIVITEINYKNLADETEYST